MMMVMMLNGDVWRCFALFDNLIIIIVRLHVRVPPKNVNLFHIRQMLSRSFARSLSLAIALSLFSLSLCNIFLLI